MSDTTLTLNRVQEGGLLRDPCPIGVMATEIVDGILVGAIKLQPESYSHNVYTAHCNDCQIYFKFTFHPKPFNVVLMVQGLRFLLLSTCPSCKANLVLPL